MDHSKLDVIGLICPRLDIINGRAIPIVSLPREGYRDLVSRFYETKGKEEVVEYANGLNSLLKADLRLFWDDEKGLKSIGIGVHAGFDLDERMSRYAEHNIYSLEQAIPVFLVATKYVSLLL